MATPGKKLSLQEQARVRRLREAGLSIRRVAHEERISTRTAQKYLKPENLRK